MGLFGDDTPFRTQQSWGDTGGSAPAGWYTAGNAPKTATGSTPLQFYNPNNGQITNTGELGNLLGPGSDSVGNATGWRKPGTFSNQNLDLIMGNKDSLAQGNNLPFATQAFQRSFLNDPTTVMSDPSAYMYNGDPNFAKNQQAALAMQAAAAEGRQAPSIDGSATNMFMTGAGNSLGQANGTNFLGVGNAVNTAGVAAGAGYQGQLASAQGLMGAANGPAVQNQFNNADALTKMATGPAPASMAQLQLAAGAQQSMQQQMAMAAGARGGNAALALQNAGQNQGQAMGQLNQSQALLRAQEELNNRNFSASALQGAAGMYGSAGQLQGTLLGAAGQGFGNAAGTQLGAYGTAGQQLGQIAQNQTQQAGTQVTMGGIYADLAKQQAADELAKQQQNDAYSAQMQQLGQQYLSDQLHASSAYDQNRTGNTANILTNQYANRDRSGEGTITGSGGGDKALGAGMSAFATTLPYLSDIQQKQNISAAPEDISNAYRMQQQSAMAQGYSGYAAGQQMNYAPPANQAYSQQSMPGAQMALGGQNANMYASAQPQQQMMQSAAPQQQMMLGGGGGAGGGANMYGNSATANMAANPYGNSATANMAAAPVNNQYAAGTPQPRANANQSASWAGGPVANAPPSSYGNLAGQQSLAKAPAANYGAANTGQQNMAAAPAQQTSAPAAGNQSDWQKLAAMSPDQQAQLRAYAAAQQQPQQAAQKPAFGAAIGSAAGMALSDTREKQAKARADAAIADAYRQGGMIRDTNVQYPAMASASFPDAPGYSYEYKNPEKIGAAPGIHYGPMAQDLEKTPAGASVVKTMPDGSKGVDTGRLSLLNTSELSRQRKELDALKAQAAAIMGAKVAYPQVTQPALAMGASPYSIGGV